MTADFEAALVAGAVSLIGLVVNYIIARNETKLSEARMRQEAAEAAARHKHDDETLLRQYQLEFATERVARELMMDQEWRLRSFETIKHHLAGFTDDKLRQVLVRAGAIRFTSYSGAELWGLLERDLFTRKRIRRF